MSFLREIGVRYRYKMNLCCLEMVGEWLYNFFRVEESKDWWIGKIEGKRIRIMGRGGFYRITK